MNAGSNDGFTQYSKPVSISPRYAIAEHLDRLAFVGFLATVLASSILHGVNTEWHKSAVVVSISAFAVVRIIADVLKGTFRIAEVGLLAPLLGVLILGGVQAVRLPFMTSALSVAPYETLSFLFFFGGLIVAGEALFRYIHFSDARRHLILIVSVIGVTSALFGVLRPVFFDSIFESLAASSRLTEGYAQFVNRNHFALLVEMTLGLLTGILLKGALSVRFKILIAALMGILVFALITANSRGGLVSLAAISIFAALAQVFTGRKAFGRVAPEDRFRRRVSHFARRAFAAFAICTVILGLLAFAVVFVGGDRVLTRVERLKNEIEPARDGQVNRIIIWASTVELVKEKPLFGHGFGGFGAAITSHDPSTGDFPLEQAHNEYLEILAGGGIVGFLLFAIFGVLAVRRIVANLRSGDPARRSSCFGATIGLFGALVHSFVDFGLHTAVNALVFTVLVVIATAGPNENPSTAAESSFRTKHPAPV